jgi:hypothetical protein
MQIATERGVDDEQPLGSDSTLCRLENRVSRKTCVELSKLLVSRLHQAWPAVKITVRADSGFCRWRMMRWCDRHGVDYILGLAKNKRLLEMGKPLIEQAEDAFEQSHEKQRLFGEISYAAATWDRPRRVLVKAEHLDKGANPRFVVTSLPEDDPQQLYDDVYCARGEMENRIKSLS